MKKFNYNCKIRVLFNENGKNLYRSFYRENPIVDENGFMEFTMWIFMHDFGKYLCKDILEDGCIYMDEENFED